MENSASQTPATVSPTPWKHARRMEEAECNTTQNPIQCEIVEEKNKFVVQMECRMT